MSNLSIALRGRLASFENVYAVAVQARQAGGAQQLVVATGNPIQPFRVTNSAPRASERIEAMVA